MRGLILVALATGGALLRPDAATALVYSPKAEDVCVRTLDQFTLDKARLIANFLDAEQVTGWTIDTSGAITPQEQANAVHLAEFCGLAGSHCSKTAAARLRDVRADFRQFLQRAVKGIDAAVRLSPRPGNALSDDLVTDFFEDRYIGICAPPAAPPPAPASASAEPPPAAAPAETQAPSLASRIEVRSKIGDLAYDSGDTAFKGLSAATIGFDANAANHVDTVTSSGVIGFRLDRLHPAPTTAPSARIDLIPFLGLNLKKVESKPPPKTGNLDTLSGGVLGDALFPLGFYHELQFYPQVAHSYQDASETVSANLTYIPEPAIPVIGAIRNIGDEVYISARPSFNLSYQHLVDAGENAALRATGSYWRYGPGVDFSVFGYPGSLLQQFSLAASYRYLRNAAARGPDPITNFTSALSYTPPGQQNVSVTFKYVVGNDLDTLTSQKEYTLGLGVKY